MKKISVIKWLIVIVLVLFTFNISINTLGESSSVDSSATISLVSKTYAYSSGSPSYVTQTLSNRNTISPKINTIYKLCLGFVDIFVFIVLILIALANILHWNINTYQIKAVLPKVLIALLVAHLAMPIFAILSAVVDQLGSLNIFKPISLASPSILLGAAGGGAAAGFASWGVASLAAMLFSGLAVPGLNIFVGCCVALFVGFPILLFFILNFLLALRGWVVILGAAIAPLALGCYILPQTEGLFRRWLKIVLFWLFYPLIVWGLVHLALMIPSLGGVAGAGITSKIIGFIIPLAVKIWILIMAIRAPFMWEKDIGGITAAVGRMAGSAGWKGAGFAMGAGPYAWNKMLATGAGKKAVAAFQKLDPSGKAAKRVELFKKSYVGRVVDARIAHDAQAAGQTVEEYEKANPSARENESRIIETDPAHQARMMREMDREKEEAKKRFKKANIDDFQKEEMDRLGFDSRDELANYLKNPANRRDYRRRFNARFEERHEAQVNAKTATELGGEAAIATVRGEGGWRGKLHKALFTAQKFNPYGAVAALRERADVYSKNMDKAPWKTSEVTRFLAGQETYFKHQQAIQREDLSHIYTLEALRGSNYGLGFEKLAKGYMKEKGLSSLEAAMQMLHADLQRLYQEQASASEYLNNLGGAAKKGGVIPSHFAAVVEGFDRQRSLAASEARGYRSAEERRTLREEAERNNERVILGLSRGPSGAVGTTGAGGVGRPTGYAQPFTPAERKIIELLNLSTRRVGMLGQIRAELASQDPQQVETLIRDIHQTDGSDSDRDRLLGRVTAEFGGSENVAQIVRQFTDSRKQQLTLFGSEEGAQLSARIAEKIAARPDISVEMVQQTVEACRTVAQPAGVSPDQLKKAKVLIGSHAGIEGETITPEMAARVAQGLELMAQRNPINPT
ncbi:MAG: hypothetical protein OEV37_00390 [Candidatus Berkelbacteria bacterium]|nr:hypothetical protein [Candidatus Berkelbacteria bacterium]